MTEREFYEKMFQANRYSTFRDDAHKSDRYNGPVYDAPISEYYRKACAHMLTRDITVNVGDKTYYPITGEFNTSCDAPAELELSVRLGSLYEVPAKPKLSITNVIFNPPATIVFWSDHTKTVVKCDTSLETYDPEKGIAMAISRKMLGDNKREYYNTFLHWLKRYDKQPEEETVTMSTVIDGKEFTKTVTEAVNEPRKRRNRIARGINT